MSVIFYILIFPETNWSHTLIECSYDRLRHSSFSDRKFALEERGSMGPNMVFYMGINNLLFVMGIFQWIP